MKVTLEPSSPDVTNRDRPGMPHPEGTTPDRLFLETSTSLRAGIAPSTAQLHTRKIGINNYPGGYDTAKI